MSENLILDNGHEPSMNEINLYFAEKARKNWSEMVGFIEQNYKTKQQISYSTCSGKPGWNVKYKKSSKALCTLYPEKDLFTVLIVLGRNEIEVFEETREEFSPYINDLYDQSALFNGTKWLMIEVTDDIILEDVKELIMMKTSKVTK